MCMPARAQSRIPPPAQQDPAPRSTARPSEVYGRPLTARGASATPRRDSDSYIPRRAASASLCPYSRFKQKSRQKHRTMEPGVL